MSASLVGSEMCIRDRPGPASGSARRPPPVAAARQAVRRQAWQLARRRASVSYTHLTLPTICSV
eukprot:15032718-Alexandrium_andersonii.AAC.1